jgi:tetratricopeptide (TPR) repeat protein
MPSQSTIDEITAEIIRTALGAARAGRTAEAHTIAERGIAEGNDSGALNGFIGALYCADGRFDAAIAPLQKATEQQPDNLGHKRNLVGAFLQTERFAEAVALLTDEVVDADPSMNFLRQRAYSAHMDGQLDLAISDYRRFLSVNGSDWESWNNLGNAYLNAGDLEAAIEALRTAARINPRAAPTRLNLARSLRDFGDLTAAEAELRQMAQDFPNDEKPLIDLYHLLGQLGRPEAELEEALEAAAVRDPANPDLLIALGDHQLRYLAFDKAEATYRRVLSLSPSSAAAYLGLAQTLEHVRPDDLAALVIEAEAANVDDHAQLSLIRAFADRRAKKYDEGLVALQSVPEDVEAAIRWHLAGQMFEALGRYDEAFDAFTAMNNAHAADQSEPLRRAAELRAVLRDQLERTTEEWYRGWTAPAVQSRHPAPVFLMGFPRSGTTLLDTILMGHPNVAVMEEQPLLQSVGLGTAGFESLSELGEDEIRRLQDRYFELASERVGLSGQKLLIDKSPLHLHRIPQILRLFPDAHFILALRHPADAVLGCFKANFRLNNAMSNFLDLGTAAEFYDLTFQMWERGESLLSPVVHTVRYESLIEDPEATVRPLIEGLGLDWTDRVLDHQRTARDRGIVTTASYAQVTEPIYRHAEGRWRNYSRHLEPILPVLAPWVGKYGYTL